VQDLNYYREINKNNFITKNIVSGFTLRMSRTNELYVAMTTNLPIFIYYIASNSLE